MSRVKPDRCVPADPRSGGFTLFEIVIVVVLISILTVTITVSMRSLTTDQAYLRGQHKVREVADRVARGIERDLTFVVRVFDQATGARYLEAMDIPKTILPGSRMPVFTEQGYFEKDPRGVVETGNMLFVGTSLGPVTIDLSAAQDGSDTVRVEVLHLVLYYLRQKADGRLDLGRWVSVPMARHAHVTAVTDVVRQLQLREALAAEGVHYSWDVQADRDTALYQLVDPVTSRMVLLDPPKRVPADSQQVRTGIFARRRESVAGNGALKRVPVPELATRVGNSLFPGGLEVKVDRTSAGKLVWIQLVIVRQAGGFPVPNFAKARRLVICRNG